MREFWLPTGLSVLFGTSAAFALDTAGLQAAAICKGIQSSVAAIEKDKNASVSFDEGKFKVTNSNGSIEIYYQTELLGQLQSGTYDKYVECVKETINLIKPKL